jgi:hypothetical protein
VQLDSSFHIRGSPELNITERTMANGRQIFQVKVPVFMQQLMKDFGLTAVQAAGVFGNIGQECSGFTILHELGEPEGKGGYGWAQWTGSRREAFFDWCNQHNLKYTDDEANYGFLEYELRTSEQPTILALQKTSTLEGAVQTFATFFERPGILALKSREDWAALALDAFKKSPTIPTG